MSSASGTSTPHHSKEEVAALVVRERQCRDRQRWDDMAECFTGDATIDMSWYTGPAAGFIERSRSMDVGGSRGVHRLSPPVVHVSGDRALAELPLVIEFRTDIDGVQADLCSCARSQYRAVRSRGAWRICAVTAVYERDTLAPAVPNTVLPVTADAFAGLRPSYRCLAWHLRRSGYDIADDLPGDDRPDTVSAVMAADLAWLVQTDDAQHGVSVGQDQERDPAQPAAREAARTERTSP